MGRSMFATDSIPEIIANMLASAKLVREGEDVREGERHVRWSVEELERRGALETVADIFHEWDFREVSDAELDEQAEKATEAIKATVRGNDPVGAHKALTALLKAREELSRRVEAERRKGPEGLRKLLRLE